MTNRTMFQPHKFLLIVCMLSLVSVSFANEIYNAAIKGDAERVKELIAANPTARDTDEHAPVDRAEGRTEMPDVSSRDLATQWNLLAERKAWTNLISRLAPSSADSAPFGVPRSTVHPDIAQALEALRAACSIIYTNIGADPVQAELPFMRYSTAKLEHFERAIDLLDKAIRDPGQGLAGELNKSLATQLKSWCETLANIEDSEEKSVTAALQKASLQERDKQYAKAIATLYAALRHRSQVFVIRQRTAELRQRYEQVTSSKERRETAQYFAEHALKSDDTKSKIEAYCTSLANEESGDVLALLRQTFDEERAKQKRPSPPDSNKPLTEEVMRTIFEYSRYGPDDEKTMRLADQITGRLVRKLWVDTTGQKGRALAVLHIATEEADAYCVKARTDKSDEAWQHAHEACLKAKESLDYVGPLFAPSEESKKIEELLAECAKHMEE